MFKSGGDVTVVCISYFHSVIFHQSDDELTNITWRLVCKWVTGPTITHWLLYALGRA